MTARCLPPWVQAESVLLLAIPRPWPHQLLAQARSMSDVRKWLSEAVPSRVALESAIWRAWQEANALRSQKSYLQVRSTRFLSAAARSRRLPPLSRLPAPDAHSSAIEPGRSPQGLFGRSCRPRSAAVLRAARWKREPCKAAGSPSRDREAAAPERRLRRS